MFDIKTPSRDFRFDPGCLPVVGCVKPSADECVMPWVNSILGFTMFQHRTIGTRWGTIPYWYPLWKMVKPPIELFRYYWFHHFSQWGIGFHHHFPPRLGYLGAIAALEPGLQHLGMRQLGAGPVLRAAVSNQLRRHIHWRLGREMGWMGWMGRLCPRKFHVDEKCPTYSNILSISRHFETHLKRCLRQAIAWTPTPIPTAWRNGPDPAAGRWCWQVMLAPSCAEGWFTRMIHQDFSTAIFTWNPLAMFIFTSHVPVTFHHFPCSILFFRIFAGWFARIPFQCRGATGEATPEARSNNGATVVPRWCPAIGGSPLEVTGFLECVRRLRKNHWWKPWENPVELPWWILVNHFPWEP